MKFCAAMRIEKGGKLDEYLMPYASDWCQCSSNRFRIANVPLSKFGENL
uniref:Uncharacterized protein n=1 Tax=Arundo donax TaxID=35708 RepID=A0A0A9AVN4_ARUDO